MLSMPQEGILSVGPPKVFCFPSTTNWKPIGAFPDSPPGDAPSRGYRLLRGNGNLRLPSTSVPIIYN
ncbi:hypothetical protein TNIN_285401 [Trichonephila inaurata madagascariensis]|uniref:Uncharacterized protein n=1 Tax=Trichonephila inaurata madagascariensis TaxID=2747483 RepID=A0A8X6XIF8_9ARAC|nr:hypothetical protein TNIN_285401 [Trichonephila inaurata madagascariensis]